MTRLEIARALLATIAGVAVVVLVEEFVDISRAATVAIAVLAGFVFTRLLR